MYAINIKNIRCFKETKEVRIKPLTILVGENSSGKTTFLSMLQVAKQLSGGNISPNFNKDPFSLGAFEQIAHENLARGSRARTLSVEAISEFEPSDHIKGEIKKNRIKFSDIYEKEYRRQTRKKIKIVSRYIFKEKGSLPKIDKIIHKFGSFHIQAKFMKNDVLFLFKTPEGEFEEKLSDSGGPFGKGGIYEGELEGLDYDWLLIRVLTSGSTKKRGRNKQKFIELIYFIIIVGNSEFKDECFAAAPVRSRPRRTYHPVEGSHQSQGDHVSMVLARTKLTDRKKWQDLKRSLQNFGNASGMFKDINIKTLGRSDSDPFQILADINGAKTNIMDVGYGVSQILPILVDLLRGDEKKETYLLQQPEIHLHPKAQAELGTFLASIVSSTNKTIVAETHSDYLLDRVLMAVREKKIKHKDINIVFFDRSGHGVKISQLDIDEYGNIINAPKEYRSFFLEEEKRFLRFEGS